MEGRQWADLKRPLGLFLRAKTVLTGTQLAMTDAIGSKSTKKLEKKKIRLEGITTSRHVYSPK